MLEGEMKPAQQRVVLVKYFRQFLKWALKLSLEDMLTLARFLRTVQAAHEAGKTQAEADAAAAAANPPETVQEPQEPPRLILPGLGGDPAGGSFIKHQESRAPGASYGALDAMMPPTPRKPA